MPSDLQIMKKPVTFTFYCTGILKPHCIRCSHFKVDDVSALEASSNRSVGPYALLKTTSQRHCISNVRHDHGYGLDAVTT
jgi:hypothetical protein